MLKHSIRRDHVTARLLKQRFSNFLTTTHHRKSHWPCDPNIMMTYSAYHF